MFHFIARMIYVSIVALSLILPASVSAEISDFDHFATGFPLTGGHRNVECETCHRAGIFRGTPRQCATCHSQQEIAAESVKPANHIPSSNECQDCHDERRWGPVRRIDHAAVFGSCASCHNGVRATGKPVNHMPTQSWLCDDCHRTNAWVPAHFRHRNVQPGQCTTCHNGTTATGRPTNTVHQIAPLVTWSCDACHTTRGWVPAQVNHNGLTAPCSTCHNNTVVIGKPSNHFATTQECNFCHSTRAWVPANYNHSGYYPRHGWSMRCNSCHSSSPQSASNAYKTPAYAQSCAGCHYNDYLKEHSAGSIQSKKDCQNCHEHATSLTRGKW